MRLSLSPKDSAFYDLFSNLARHTVTGASILTEMLGVDVPARVDLAKVFTDVEHAADDDADAIMKRVNQTFVTPFDRDDIYDLTSALDDAVDAMEEAADLIVLYKLDVLPTKVGDMVQVLQRCAELTVDAMPKLRTLDQLEDYCKEIDKLEHRGDKLHRKLIAKLFDEEKDAIQLIKLKGIYDVLEDACDAFSAVAEVVETIALKES